MPGGSKAIPDQLLYIFSVLDASKDKPLAEVLDPNKIIGPVYKAIMMGTGMACLSTWNMIYRDNRMQTLSTGIIEEPIGLIDPAIVLKRFNSRLEKESATIKEANDINVVE